MTSARAYRPARAARGGARRAAALRRHAVRSGVGRGARKRAGARRRRRRSRQLQELLGRQLCKHRQCEIVRARSGLSARSFSLFACLLLASAAPLASRHGRRQFAIDTAASIDETRRSNGNNFTGVILDAVMSVGFGARLRGHRPSIVQRLANRASGTGRSGSRRFAIERAGPIGVRVDGGLIPSPIGLANLTAAAASQPDDLTARVALSGRCRRSKSRGPRAKLLGAVYPFGATRHRVGRALGCAGGRHRHVAAAHATRSSPARTRRVSTTSWSEAASRRSSASASAHR